MTVTAPTTTAPPSVRSVREWMIALAQSLACTALGVLMVLVAFGSLLTEFDEDPPGALVAMHGLDAVLGVVVTLAIGPLRFLRPGRLHSVLHLIAASVAGLSTTALAASAIALYRLGLRRRPGLDALAVLLVAVTSILTMALDASIRAQPVGVFFTTTIAVMVVGALVPLLIGHVVGTRHELVASLRDRAASADRERETAQRERAAAEREAAALVRERDADAARVRAEERAALARDMHDSISHHLATIAMHSGAMSYREDLPREELRRTAGTVRDAAQQANRELRTVLMTLRTTDGETPLATAPTLVEIVERARADGQDVELSWEGLGPHELETRDRSTVVALARILTEVTVNAAKHSPGAPLRLTLAREADRVVLHARNPCSASPATAPTSTGHGLLGVQERARLLGGDARHGVRGEDFEVQAWMPW
ncbi:sensor histidine kinase [Brachybacterium sacelli]|uniref:histidine kinase n=1 Tax=Brachybacterium sacelli TaxID=173364 RepID=A0ABS4WXY9_9MICO|nr:histidine kinase [Brachybacterium sacelli]MBP2381058.1 signal transduction histidine kinase [Brachybacterium sacelli]